nr:MAG: internal scaffolding protein [Microvirus sp.]
MEVSLRNDKVRNGLDYDGPEFDPGCDCSSDPDTGEELVSMAKQSFRDECDINTIMKRYESTGTIDHINRRQPSYGDFTDVPSFHEALETVREAEALFAGLPASVRDRFGNDPGKLMEFLADPANKDEAIELGLIDRPAPPAEPTEVRIVPDPKAAERPPVAQGATPSQGA